MISGSVDRDTERWEQSIAWIKSAAQATAFFATSEHRSLSFGLALTIFPLLSPLEKEQALLVIFTYV